MPGTLKIQRKESEQMREAAFDAIANAFQRGNSLSWTLVFGIVSLN